VSEGSLLGGGTEWYFGADAAGRTGYFPRRVVEPVVVPNGGGDAAGGASPSVGAESKPGGNVCADIPCIFVFYASRLRRRSYGCV